MKKAASFCVSLILFCTALLPVSARGWQQNSYNRNEFDQNYDYNYNYDYGYGYNYGYDYNRDGEEDDTINYVDRTPGGNKDEEDAEQETVPLVLSSALSEDGLSLKLAAKETEYGFRIVIPTDCEASIAYAAGLLQSAISQMTGRVLPIVSDIVTAREREILVGATNRAADAGAGLTANGYSLRVEGTYFYIAGGSAAGVVRGVYAFLEDYCGWQYFAEDTYTTPKPETVSIPADLQASENAYFAFTEVGTRVNNEAFLRYNGLTGGAYTAISRAEGGTVGFLTAPEATLGGIFCSESTYFNDHPEYFALVKGKRVPTALCLSDWNVYSVVLQEILALLEEKWDASMPTQVIALGQIDPSAYCSCEKCAAADAENGGHMATLLTFSNNLAAALIANGYTNVALQVCAKGSTLTPPLHAAPMHNVIIRLSTESCCFAHPLQDTACNANASFLELLQTWKKIAAHIYIEYEVENRAQTLGLFPDIFVLRDNIRLFYTMGIEGISAVDSPYRAECGEEFRALRFYLLAKLLQDPYTDTEAAENAFLEAYYGPGWANLRQFLSIVGNNTGDTHGHLGIASAMKDSLRLTAAQVDTCEQLWENTLRACVDGRQVLHTQNSMLAFRYWEAACEAGVFSGSSHTAQARQLISDLRKAGITRYSVASEGFRATRLYAHISPERWNRAPMSLLAPILKVILGIAAVPVCLWAIAAAVYALKRKKYFFFALPWLVVLQCCLLPWHAESFVQERPVSFWLTNILLLLTLAAFCIYGQCCEPESGYFHAKKLPRAIALWLLPGVMPHTLLWLLPSLLGQDRDGAILAAVTYAALYAAVAVSYIGVRLVRRELQRHSPENEYASALLFDAYA